MASDSSSGLIGPYKYTDSTWDSPSDINSTGLAESGIKESDTGIVAKETQRDSSSLITRDLKDTVKTLSESEKKGRRKRVVVISAISGTAVGAGILMASLLSDDRDGSDIDKGGIEKLPPDPPDY